jgi:LuxR family transcriptional regulator, quorum-sensing system regulator BjaR1
MDDSAATLVFALTRRERECLLWVARGKTYAETGEIIGLSFGSVKTYLDRSRLKLNCATLAQATAQAVARGIFTHDDLLGR